MKLVPLGRTGLKVSQLALGTMTFGDPAAPDTAAEIFHRCREAGINHFDTADVYQKGRSEEILGELIRPCREQVVLASKVYFPTSTDPNARGGSRLHLVRSVEASLRRLGTDRIDLLYLHRFDDATRLDETLRGLDHLIARGMVLYPAVSNFAAWQTTKALGLQHALGFAPIVALQPMYNLAKRQAEVEILPMAQSEGLAVFPYSPLGGGLLSGRYGASERPAEGRLSTWEIYRVRYGATGYYDLADRFRALASEHGAHPVSLAIAWVMSHPAVTAPLIGARNLAQLAPALAAGDVAMTDDLRAAISALSPTPPPATDRNEEGATPGPGAR
jgi:aryl-alcohol dehydrogenase-like predicted oxidoreductase